MRARTKLCPQRCPHSALNSALSSALNSALSSASAASNAASLAAAIGYAVITAVTSRYAALAAAGSVLHRLTAGWCCRNSKKHFADSGRTLMRSSVCRLKSRYHRLCAAAPGCRLFLCCLSQHYLTSSAAHRGTTSTASVSSAASCATPTAFYILRPSKCLPFRPTSTRWMPE